MKMFAIMAWRCGNDYVVRAASLGLYGTRREADDNAERLYRLHKDLLFTINMVDINDEGKLDQVK